MRLIAYVVCVSHICHDAEQEKKGAEKVFPFRDPGHGLYMQRMETEEETGHPCRDQYRPLTVDR